MKIIYNLGPCSNIESSLLLFTFFFPSQFFGVYQLSGFSLLFSIFFLSNFVLLGVFWKPKTAIIIK